MSFTEERAKLFYFAEIGLTAGRVGLSRPDLPEITNLKQLSGLKGLASLGGVNRYVAVPEINVILVADLELNKIEKLLRLRRGDFAIEDGASYNQWQRRNTNAEIRVHPECCGGMIPIYIGFSKTSLMIDLIPNHSYDMTKPLSPYNQTIAIRPDSFVQRFIDAVRRSSKDYLDNS